MEARYGDGPDFFPAEIIKIHHSNEDEVGKGTVDVKYLTLDGKKKGKKTKASFLVSSFVLLGI